MTDEIYILRDMLDAKIREAERSRSEGLQSAIDNAPAGRLKAKWERIRNTRYPAHSHDKCSSCGWINTKNAHIGIGRDARPFAYCPCCGAEMENR